MNSMYQRAKGNSLGSTKVPGEEKELKDFYLKAHIPTDSFKTVSKLNELCIHVFNIFC